MESSERLTGEFDLCVGGEVWRVVVVVKCWGSFSFKTNLASDECRDRHINRSFLECEKSLGGDLNGG
jgi:hypothetical protein